MALAIQAWQASSDLPLGRMAASFRRLSIPSRSVQGGIVSTRFSFRWQRLLVSGASCGEAIRMGAKLPARIESPAYEAKFRHVDAGSALPRNRRTAMSSPRLVNGVVGMTPPPSHCSMSTSPPRPASSPRRQHGQSGAGAGKTFEGFAGAIGCDNYGI